MKERLRNVVSDVLGVNIDRVTDESKFCMDLDADSLDLVELVMAVEEEFDIEIPDTAVNNLVSFKDMLSYIEENA